MEDAACRGMAPDGREDPDIFFPERGQTAIGNEAIIVCFNCPVRQPCENYRKATGTEYGIWGGKFTKRTD